MKTTAKILLFVVVWIGCGLIGAASVRARECADLRKDVREYRHLYKTTDSLDSRKTNIKRFLRSLVVFGPPGMIVGILISGLFYDGIEFTDACLDAIQPSEAQQ
jgi:hypothetical protein